MAQVALNGFITAAMFDNQKTNIRVNEMYLAARVEYDTDAEKHGVMKASDYAKAYEYLLNKPDVEGCKVTVGNAKHLDEP
jgi:hypothetical protein